MGGSCEDARADGMDEHPLFQRLRESASYQRQLQTESAPQSSPWKSRRNLSESLQGGISFGSLRRDRSNSLQHRELLYPRLDSLTPPQEAKPTLKVDLIQRTQEWHQSAPTVSTFPSTHHDSFSLDSLQHSISEIDTEARCSPLPRSKTPSPTPPPVAPRMIEVAPGLQVPLRGAQETCHAMEAGYMERATCLWCCSKIACIADAAYILCPSCKAITRMDQGEWGLGLGVHQESL